MTTPTGVPPIPAAVLKEIWQAGLKNTLSRGMLEQIAQRGGWSLGELVWGCLAQQGGTGTAAGYAKSAVSAIQALPEAALIAEEAAAAAAAAGETALTTTAGREAGRWSLRGGLALLAVRLGTTVPRLLVGGVVAALVLGAGALAWSVWGGSEPGETMPPGTEGPCPEIVQVTKKCPWSPDGYTVAPCNPGFCFDAGPQGALHCVQENEVPHSYRLYGTGLRCEDGYTPVKDRCSGVLLECVSSS